MAREEVGLDDLLQFPQLADQRPMSEAERWFVARVHAMHDLRHVVTGYGVDRFGELCLLAFRTAQHPHPGMRFLCRFGVWKVSRDLPGVPVQSAVREATARGRAAAWLDAAPWETLLPIGLAETQRRLGVQAPAIYAAATATWPGPTTIDAEATVRDAA
jgi:ubiquinone biosynthesis protein Coq4